MSDVAEAETSTTTESAYWRKYEMRQRKWVHLRNSRIWRRGETAPNWYGETDIAHIKPDPQKGELVIGFDIASKGGGTTKLQVRITPENFATILAYMSRTDREAAMRAMAEEMRYQVCENTN